ncbi:hypothetical protein ACF0H5_001734 [Mactra antiquata]
MSHDKVTAVKLTKCKKKDVFAPRKSVQDAKEKLGPAYFDPTLLECSRNAVELTKLVQQWENIDKEKAKFVRDLRREQNALAKSFRKNISLGNVCQDETDSSEGIETTDGRPIPPGFRFRSNGEIKSMTSLLLYQEDETKDSCNSLSTACNNKSLANVASKRKDITKEQSLYHSVDYQKEIEELEGVINEMSSRLSTCKLSGSSATGSKCYLRSHSHDVSKASFSNTEYKLTERLKTSRERKLHQYMIKTPCSRACSGCQYKLKPKSDTTQIVRKEDKDIMNRRWCYVPTGKYVQSSSALKSSTSLLRKSSSRALNSSSSILRPCSSRAVSSRADNCENDDNSADKSNKRRQSVQFDLDTKNTVAPDRRHSACALSKKLKSAKSSPAVDRKIKSAGEIPKSIALDRARSMFGLSAMNTDCDALDDEDSQRTSSVASLKSKLSAERIGSRLLIDYDSRINMLKEYQSEEEKHCQEKVNDFLQQLGKGKR